MLNKTMMTLALVTLAGCNSPGITVTETTVNNPPTTSPTDPTTPTTTPTSGPTSTPTTGPTSTPTSGPTSTPSGTATIVSTATNSDHTCSIMSDNSIQCSGNNANLQAPASITNVPTPQSLVVGSTFSAALDLNGNVWTWGKGSMLGLGSTQADSATPLEAISDNSVLAMSAYGNYICAVDNSPIPTDRGQGLNYCWGTLGAQTNYVPTLTAASNIAANGVTVASTITCSYGTPALSGNQEILTCWGPNNAPTDQTLLFDNGIGSSMTVNNAGLMCIAGTYNSHAVTRCYSFFDNGDLS